MPGNESGRPKSKSNRIPPNFLILLHIYLLQLICSQPVFHFLRSNRHFWECFIVVQLNFEGGRYFITRWDSKSRLLSPIFGISHCDFAFKSL